MKVWMGWEREKMMICETKASEGVGKRDEWWESSWKSGSKSKNLPSRGHGSREGEAGLERKQHETPLLFLGLLVSDYNFQFNVAVS